MRMISTLFVSFLLLLTSSHGKRILQLQGDNFELALTSYKYIAILFYDDSRAGNSIRREWVEASNLATELPSDSEMAMISGQDVHIKELIEAYGIAIPSVRVFRRGIMADYRGPYDSAGIAEYLNEDALPSVKKLSTIQEMKALLTDNQNTILFGLFNEEEVQYDETFEGYSIDAWGQYQAAGDSLRGHASFYLIDSKDILSSFKLKPSDLPVVYMASSEDGDGGFIKYTGEILEMNLAEWVLRNSAPAMAELTITSSAGELYATQFFSSKKLKFILFLTPAMLGEVEGASSAVLDAWRAVANAHKGQAIFSYMTQNAVADVMDYFAIDVDKDVPLIAAHQPASDFKYKSKRLDLTDSAAMLDFVSGVVSGSVDKVFRSEAVPLGNKGPVITAVGSTVLDIVSKENKDVMLMVYTPWCANCRKLLPTFDILGRAVEAENRVVVVRLDASKNDIPAAWGVKSYPALLWFPSKDKPYMSSPPQPRPYWDAGQSLQELVSFVQRQSSFDLKTLRVATSEQIGSLLGDEEVLRTKYDEQERTFKRNEGRAVYDQPIIDYLLGEVVFDGKRGHFIVAALLLLICLVQFAYIIVLKNLTAATIQKKKK